VIATPPRRTLDQSAKLWSIADDIAKSGHEWGGITLSKTSWFRLLVASVYGQKMVPALDGNGFVFVDARTSRMTKAQISEVIAFAEAWAVTNGIELSDEQGE
jgi:hypothetical protein